MEKSKYIIEGFNYSRKRSAVVARVVERKYTNWGIVALFWLYSLREKCDSALITKRRYM